MTDKFLPASDQLSTSSSIISSQQQQQMTSSNYYVSNDASCKPDQCFTTLKSSAFPVNQIEKGKIGKRFVKTEQVPSSTTTFYQLQPGGAHQVSKIYNHSTVKEEVKPINFQDIYEPLYARADVTSAPTTSYMSNNQFYLPQTTATTFSHQMGYQPIMENGFKKGLDL